MKSGTKKNKKKKNPKHHSTQSGMDPDGREVGGIHKWQNEVFHSPLKVHLRGISLLFPTRAARREIPRNNTDTLIEEEEEAEALSLVVEKNSCWIETKLTENCTRDLQPA